MVPFSTVPRSSAPAGIYRSAADEIRYLGKRVRLCIQTQPKGLGDLTG